VRYTIIATLGPASAQAEQWSALLDAGVSAFRLNTSHLTLDALSRWLQSLDDFSRRRGEQTPLILDLQGSKWRLGRFEPLVLNPGDSVVLIHSAEAIEPGTLPVPHADFFRAALRSSGRISINDARSVLAVESVGDDRVVARVVAGGTVSPRKGITFVDSDYRLEVLNEADRLAVDLTASLDGIRYAVSYVRDGHEMKRYRDLLGKDRHLIAKLERPQALAEADRVAAASDELWLCRGDLGAEIGLRAMAETVHRFAAGLSSLPVPALLAGQVLEHMNDHPLATRAELCNLYDALAAGFSGVVLSDETAIGRFPAESCRMAALFRGSN